MRLAHYCLGELAPFFLMVYVDDFAMLSVGEKMALIQLAFLWLLEIIGLQLSWKKCRGGYEFNWVGYHLLLRSFRIGLSESRAAWIIKWVTSLLAARRCHVGEFAEALGRLGFAVEALEYEKPFLAPLYKFAAVHGSAPDVKLPLYVLMVLVWIRSRIERRHTCPCRERRLPLSGALRVDARAVGSVIGIGGWAPVVREDGSVDKAASPWFMLELKKETAPWAYEKGEPYRSIMALELFATTVAVALLGPKLLAGRPAQGQVVLPSLADNLGSTHVISKGTSSKYPLCIVAMELAARLDAYAARLEACWVPRELNAEADALSNFNDAGFAPGMRVGSASASCIPLVVIPNMMAAAQEFFTGADGARETLPLPRPAKRRKRVKLSERDPW